jgi:hypothetical protein
MNIVDYSSKGATIQFGQTELLLIMALLQKGANSLGCNNTISRRIDRQISLANLLVENERRESVQILHFTKETHVALSAAQSRV